MTFGFETCSIIYHRTYKPLGIGAVDAWCGYKLNDRIDNDWSRTFVLVLPRERERERLLYTSIFRLIVCTRICFELK